jgi:predicted enzyme related to lactoylglutathione lyase
MERVVGIGGIFFKASNKKALGEWYRDNLGVPLEEDWGGAVFPWKVEGLCESPYTVWSPFAADTTYFAPSEKPFMINMLVRDLEAMRTQLLANGCDVDERVEENEFGKFGWVMDPEGNRIELLQPPSD